jgi:hypothetical protein
MLFLKIRRDNSFSKKKGKARVGAIDVGAIQKGLKAISSNNEQTDV